MVENATELVERQHPAQPKACAPLVEIRVAELDLPAATQHIVAASLSPAEQERAARFYFDLHRRRYIAGRGILRNILAEVLQVAPADLTFKEGDAGKLFLSGRFARSNLYFNLSHCEGLAVVAFATGMQIGVDVERVRQIPESDELVARFFSPRESRLFAELEPAARAEAFLNLWTRKEAWLKATGEGIAHSLHLLEVSFLPGEPARLFGFRTPGEGSHYVPASGWSLKDFVPREGYVAAVVASHESISVRMQNWADPPHDEVNHG